MAILSEPNIRGAFERSNIEASYWDYQGAVLERALPKAGLPSSAVLALSQVELSLKADGSSMGTRSMLLVISASGLVLAEEKGILNKRVEQQTISYKSISVLPDEKRYDVNRGEMAIQGMVGGTVPSFRIGWYWSNRGTSAADAAAERDRILDVIRQGIGDVPVRASAAVANGLGAAGLPSMKQHLMDWTEGLFREAGIAPVQAHVESVARTAAVGLFVDRVVRYADSRPLPALQRYCRSLPGELADRFDQFDEIYSTWIRLSTEEAAGTRDPSGTAYIRIRHQLLTAINQAIDNALRDSRGSFLDGICRDYG